MLQWGHACEGVETACYQGKFIAIEWLQWGHACEGVETSLLKIAKRRKICSFNGATPVKAWKPYLIKSSKNTGICFNGATPVKAWKRRRAGRDAT